MPQVLELPYVLAVLLLLLITCSRANHNRWWSCNSECARCVRTVMSMEDLIVQFYPGLFRPTPPENGQLLPEVTGSTVNSGTAEIPGSGSSALTTNNSNHSVFTAASREGGNNTGRRQNQLAVSSGCCETQVEYHTPATVRIGGQTYQVVHLKNAFQFIPHGKCREGSTCSNGECRAQYRAHWILLYNTTKPTMGPPVSFSAIEVPSHCECVNVGRPLP